jgi:hypothetical protein
MNNSYEADHVSHAYVCSTCESGYVCKGCIGKFDPYGSAFQNMKYVKKTIKCPCCRQLNWKYQFNQIIKTTLGYDMFDYEQDKPALMLYVNNNENYN